MSRWRLNRSAAILLSLLLATLALRLDAQSSAACNARQTFARADGLLKNKNYAEARAALDPLRRCANLTDIERFNLGWFYGRARDFHTSLSIFRSLPADVPDPSTHQYAIALGEFELGDLKNVVLTLKSAQSQGALDPRSANLLGVSYSKLGLYKEGYAVLAGEIQRNPQDMLAYMNLVELFADSDDYPQAAAIATRATMTFPNNPEVFIVLGAADSLNGNYSKAHDDLEKAIQLAPHQAQPRFLLAISDYKQRDLKKAVTEIQQAIADGIVDSDLHYLLAECLFELDASNEQAVSAELNRAIAINPENVSARTMRGRMLLEHHHPQEAIADLEVAHKADPTSHSTTYALARALAAVGRKTEANALFAQLNGQVSQDLENQRKMETIDELSRRRLKEALAGGKPQ